MNLGEVRAAGRRAQHARKREREGKKCEIQCADGGVGRSSQISSEKKGVGAAMPARQGGAVE